MYTDDTESRGLYRSRRRILFGVCRGLAEYLNISVGATRLLVFLAFWFTGFWPVGVLYLLAAVLLKSEPRNGTYCRREFAYCAAEAPSKRGLSRAFEGLDRRMQRIEDIVTSRAYDWDERLNRG